MTHLEKAREELNKLSADALLITLPANRFYLSGFYGTAGYLLITKNKAQLITDSRYTSQAAIQAKEFEIISKADTDFTPVSALVASEGIKRLAYEDTQMSVFTFSILEKTLPGTEFIPCGSSVSEMRREKSTDEAKKVKASLSLASEALTHVLTKLHAGMTECEVAAELENYMRRGGALKPSFDTICASGAYSAMPHHTASDKPLQNGDFLVMDFGCVLDGYCSDITRTVVIGKASEQQREIYAAVQSAQLEAEKYIGIGKSAAEVDKLARDIITHAGYGKNFTHSLGHGVGIEIHEAPTLSPHSETSLAAGDIVTVEPGIYIDGFGGVRIEDMVYIGDGGAEILTDLPRELIEIK